jgi:hypothetical protein
MPTTVLDRFRLDDKVAVVTGASSGLGVAFAVALSEAGADVVLAGRRTDRLEQTRAIVEAHGRRALVVTADVSRPEEAQAVIDAAIDHFERVDILVNNAGKGTAVPATKEMPDEFREVIDINLNGCYWMAQACGRVMNPGSAIVNISSVAALTSGHQGWPDRAHPRPRGAVDRTQGHPRQRARARIFPVRDDGPVPRRLPRVPAPKRAGRAGGRRRGARGVAAVPRKPRRRIRDRDDADRRRWPDGRLSRSARSETQPANAILTT